MPSAMPIASVGTVPSALRLLRQLAYTSSNPVNNRNQLPVLMSDFHQPEDQRKGARGPRVYEQL